MIKERKVNIQKYKMGENNTDSLNLKTILERVLYRFSVLHFD